MSAEILERRALLLQCFEARLSLHRLGRQLLDGFAMLAQLPVGTDRVLRRLLRLLGGILQCLNAFVDLFDLARSIVERVETVGNLVEARRYAHRLLADLFERLGQRHQLCASSGERREHRADRAPLFARAGDEQLELVGLLLD